MFSRRSSSGFIIIAAMIFMLVMTAVSLFCMELNINNLKMMKHCNKMDNERRLG